MLRYLIEKEFKQVLRHSFIPKLVFVFPTLMMLLLPWAANLEVKNIHLSVVDRDHSPCSERLIRKMGSSGYFRLVDLPESYAAAMEGVEEGTADVILEIPPRFERELQQEGRGRVMISVNTVNGTKGGLSVSYLNAILGEYAGELSAELAPVGGIPSLPVIDVVPQNRFNPHLNYKLFMVPVLMVVLMMLLCGFLPALSIVGEKESGTIEQLNVTPMGKFLFILSKLIPFWVIGFIVLSYCFLLAWLFYGITPVGSYLTIYLFALFFVLGISGFGLVISNYSSTMQQAMFVMFFFIIIFLLMGGFFTPIKSMPAWAQVITVVNPLKYFVQVMRSVYLKGSGIGELLPQLFAQCCFVLLFTVWAVRSYRKTS